MKQGVYIDKIIREFSLKIRDRLKNHIKKIILFGSRARGNAGEWSDYDFVVIVDKREKEIEEIVNDIDGELFGEYSKLIGSIVWGEDEWEDRKKYPIGINVLHDGIEI